jgi:hypothetical protein
MTSPRLRLGSIVALTLLLALARPAAAGPWTKNMGEFYVKAGEGFFLANSFRDAAGGLRPGVDYLSATTSLYFEVGVYNGLHVWGYLPYVVADNTFADSTRWRRASGGDAKVGLQYTPRFFALPFPAAMKLELKVPLYNANGVGVGGRYDTYFPAPGDGQLDVTFWLSAGGSLGSFPLFFFAEVGYQLRTEAFVGAGDFDAEFGDGFAFYAQVGYTLFDSAVLAVNSGGVIPFDAGSYTKGYVTLGPSIYVPIWKGLAAEASFNPMIYTNTNAAPGIGFSLGLSFKN